MSKVCLFLEIRPIEGNYELVSDVCFSLILVEVSYFLHLGSGQSWP